MSQLLTVLRFTVFAVAAILVLATASVSGTFLAQRLGLRSYKKDLATIQQELVESRAEVRSIRTVIENPRPHCPPEVTAAGQTTLVLGSTVKSQLTVEGPPCGRWLRVVSDPIGWVNLDTGLLLLTRPAAVPKPESNQAGQPTNPPSNPAIDKKLP